MFKVPLIIFEAMSVRVCFMDAEISILLTTCLPAHSFRFELDD